MKLGLHYTSSDISAAGALARWAEEKGFTTLSVGEGRFRRDAIVPMTLAAASTRSMTIASGVIPFRTRNVGLLATTFKTLARLAPGRIRLGLGTWWEPIASRSGLSTPRPVTAMREIVTVLRGLFAGETVTLKGEYVQVEGIKFESREDEAGRSYDVPIYLGAVREQMLQLTGEIADGVFLDFFAPPSHNAYSLAQIRIGLARRGRTLEGFDRPQLVICAANDADPGAAIDACRLQLTRYIAQQSHVSETCGADAGLLQAIRAEIGWPAPTSDVVRAMRLVPRELVQRVAACGTSSDVIAKLEEYQAAGATEPILVPCGDAERTLETLVKRLDLGRRPGQ